MKRWPLASLMVIGIVLLPTSLHAPSTAGQTIAPSSLNQPVTAPTNMVTTVRTVDTIAELKLGVPFNTESKWGSGIESSPGIWWNTNEGDKYFVIQDGKFISNDPTDTWFVYGWFGPLSAIKESYNIKYPEWQDRHNGIDFAGKQGVEVISASDGIVSFAGNKIGNTIIVKTGNYQITYGHLQNILVKTGQPIKVGELIGHLGNTGTTNPHLHFQVDYIVGKTRTATNPVPLINTDWSKIIVPEAPSNSFYAGTSDPAFQPNFAW